MAKELSKVGITDGLDIEAHHVSQSVDAFTGLDAYDVTLSGSLEITGSTNIKGDVVVTNGSLVSTNGNVIATAGKVIATSITSSGGILGVTISASADLYVEDDLTVGNNLEVRSNITASNNISASGNLSITGNVDVDGTSNFADDITLTGHISASGEISSSSNIGGDGKLHVGGTSNLGGAISARGGAIFNEDSADVDFRVESNANTHMFLVDAGNNRIGINVDSLYGHSTSWLSNLGSFVGLYPYQAYLQVTEVENPNNYALYSVYTANDSSTFWTYDLDLISGSVCLLLAKSIPLILSVARLCHCL